MASPLLIPNLKRILSSLSSPEIRLSGQQLRISNHLEMVTDSLWAINAVIAVANLRALEEPELSKWVWDIHTVHKDVQNILEVIQDSDWQKPEVSSSNFLLHGRITSGHYAILLELKEIAKRLNCLLSRAVTFDCSIDAMESIDPNHGDYYSIMREEVIGRDDHIIRILNILFRFQEEKASMDINSDVPLTIFITGKAGIGKSTLARMIYHHPLVCEFFNHRAWVDNSSLGIYRLNDFNDIPNPLGRLSTNFDIWSVVIKPPPQARCLFVLDGIDIIKSDWDKLEQLKKNLINLSGRGSIVIITCRDYYIIENDVEHRLFDISYDGWKEIFLRYAIPRTHSPQVKQNYSSIKNADIQSLYTRLYADWDYKSILWDAKIFSSISRYTDLSKIAFSNDKNKYYRLVKMNYASAEFAHVFLYTSLLEPLPSYFAEESCFHMLITEGIFTYSTSYQQFFFTNVIPFVITNLLNEKIFTISESIYHLRESGQESRIPQWCRYLCVHVNSFTSTFLTNLQSKIANNMRTMILYRVKEEMDFHIEKCQIASPIEIPEYLFTNLTILSIIDTNIQLLPNTIGLLLRLRYLNISEKEIEELPKSICDLHNLRVLSLPYCKKLVKLPEQIYNLSKLQILKIAHCVRLQRLPKSVTSLANLQVLDMEACHWIKELPEDLRQAERLRNLNMIGCALLIWQLTGISKLIKLEALLGYKIEDNDHASLALKELQSLMNIEQLHLRHLERVLDLDAITSVNLKEKKNLEYLVLHWEWWNMDVGVNEQLSSYEILEGLQPNLSYLKHLDVISYFSMEFPSWMRSLENLKTMKYLFEIRLINLKICDNISFISFLPCLATLEISGMESLAFIGNNIPDNEHTNFTLKSLTLSEMPILVEWNLRCHTIQELTIIHCPKLIRLSEFTKIYKVTIWLQSQFLSRDSTFFQYYSEYIKELEIVGCHEVRQLPEDIMHCNRLQTLSIIRCSKLRSLPGWWQEMPRLKQIFIIGCKRISHVSKKPKRPFADFYNRLQKNITRKGPKERKVQITVQPRVLEYILGLGEGEILWMRPKESQKIFKYLKEKKNLEYLVLHWEWWNMDVGVNEQLPSYEIIEGLQPNLSYLKHLDVISYFGMKFPSWMRSLEHLTTMKYLFEIRLINLKRCDNISFISFLPCLATLEISGMESLAFMGNNIPNNEHTYFSLESLTLSEMPILAEWNLSCHTIHELTIIHCPKLTKLSGFTKIYKVTLWLQSQFLSQDSTFFQDHFRCIRKLKIVGCHELRQLPEDIRHCNQLQTLSIIRCSQLRSLPDWWQEMPRLKKIFIIGCKRISHISKMLKGWKVQIIVQGCPQLV